MRQGRKTLPQNAIPVISNTSNAPRTIVQMTAQQPNRQNSTIATNPQSYPVTVSKNRHNLQDNNTAPSNIYTDSAAVF